MNRISKALSVRPLLLCLLMLTILLNSRQSNATPVSHTRTVHNVDYVVAGIAGVGGGSGNIIVFSTGTELTTVALELFTRTRPFRSTAIQ